MAIVNGYCTLAELKARLELTSGDWDAVLEQVIEAASRKIDGICGRRFYSATETRTYTAGDLLSLDVDDLVTVTTIATDEDGDRVWETTWDTTDYDLGPVNAAADGYPYTRIEPSPNGRYLFPTHARAVQITGAFGWSSVPDAITEATLILAARLYKRKDAPFAIAGSQELGQLTLPANDPDVVRLTNDYRRFALVGV